MSASTRDMEKDEEMKIEKLDVNGQELNSMSNIHDLPKFWPLTTKLLVLFNICLMCFNGQFYSSGPSTSFAYLVAEFNVGYASISPLVSYTVLMIGLGSIIWIPTAHIFGKRYVLIFANVIFLGSALWSAEGKSLNSILGSRVLGGFGASAVQAIGPAMIGDMFHERNYSKAVAAYTITLCLGAQIGPLVAGHIAVSLGWRWIFKFTAILIGASLAIAIPLLPETTFKLEGDTSATAAVLDEQLEEAAAGRDMRQPFWQTIRKGTLYVKHPYVQGGGLKTWFSIFIRYFPFLVDPIVLCTAALWGVSQSWVIVISVLSAQFFSPPPFNFTPADLGNWTATSMIGIIVALPLAGPAVDILSRKLSQMSGAHQPEYRLYGMIFPFLVCSPGLLLFSYTYLDGSYYGPAVGFAMQSAGLTLVPSAVISYAIDSYPFHASEITASLNLVTHLIAFGISKAAPAWEQRVGVENLFISMAAIQWSFFLVFTLILVFFGGWLRKNMTAIHARIFKE